MRWKTIDLYYVLMLMYLETRQDNPVVNGNRLTSHVAKMLIEKLNLHWPMRYYLEQPMEVECALPGGCILKQINSREYRLFGDRNQIREMIKSIYGHDPVRTFAILPSLMKDLQTDINDFWEKRNKNPSSGSNS